MNSLGSPLAILAFQLKFYSIRYRRHMHAIQNMDPYPQIQDRRNLVHLF